MTVVGEKLGQGKAFNFFFFIRFKTLAFDPFRVVPDETRVFYLHGSSN